MLFFSLSLTRPLLGFPQKDPTLWLLGDHYSGLAITTLELAAWLIPFLTFLAFLIPSLKVQVRAGAGDLMVIRLQKMGKFDTVITLLSLVITLFWWGLLLLSRLGLF